MQTSRVIHVIKKELQFPRTFAPKDTSPTLRCPALRISASPAECMICAWPTSLVPPLPSHFVPAWSRSKLSPPSLSVRPRVRGERERDATCSPEEGEEGKGELFLVPARGRGDISSPVRRGFVEYSFCRNFVVIQRADSLIHFPLHSILLGHAVISKVAPLPLPAFAGESHDLKTNFFFLGGRTEERISVKCLGERRREKEGREGATRIVADPHRFAFVAIRPLVMCCRSFCSMHDIFLHPSSSSLSQVFSFDSRRHEYAGKHVFICCPRRDNCFRPQ